MGIAMKYENLRHPDFAKAFKKIADCSDIKDSNVMVRIAKTARSIYEQEKIIGSVHQKLLEQHGTRQEDGTYKLKDVEAFTTAYVTLLETPFELELEPFKLKDLMVPAKLNASDLAALGPLVDL